VEIREEDTEVFLVNFLELKSISTKLLSLLKGLDKLLVEQRDNIAINASQFTLWILVGHELDRIKVVHVVFDYLEARFNGIVVDRVLASVELLDLDVQTNLESVLEGLNLLEFGEGIELS